MFARFKVTAVLAEKDHPSLVGVGVVMPTGEAFVDWKKPQVVNRKDKGDGVWRYPSGIAQVIDIVEDYKSLDFEWIDDPGDGNDE